MTTTKTTPKILGNISKGLYFCSLLVAFIAVLTIVSGETTQLAYTLALLSVVLMLGSSVLRYCQNLLAVSGEVLAPRQDKDPDRE